MEKKKPKQIIEMSSNTVTILTIVILAVIFLFSGFTFKPVLDNPKLIVKEEIIEKNTELQIVPGDQFIYAYNVNDSLFNLTYSASQGTGCIMIKLLENLNDSHTCLDIEGMDETGYNSTLREPTILFFKPWMLALRENWRWNNSMYMVFDDMESKVSETYFRVMRTEDYRGRLSYVVEISSETGPVEYDWVDVEKRVLLKTAGDSYTLELIEGLPLENSTGE